MRVRVRIEPDRAVARMLARPTSNRRADPKRAAAMPRARCNVNSLSRCDLASVEVKHLRAALNRYYCDPHQNHCDCENCFLSLAA